MDDKRWELLQKNLNAASERRETERKFQALLSRMRDALREAQRAGKTPTEFYLGPEAIDDLLWGFSRVYNEKPEWTCASFYGLSVKAFPRDGVLVV